MTTDSTQPQSELGQAPATGQGQSQGHRRRRRRRKNKTSQRPPPRRSRASRLSNRRRPPVQAQPQPPPAQHKRAARQPGAHQGQGRKKKKFFQKGSATAAQPGNSVSVPSQGKRKGKQKGPREFVGPMDHSYRAANGNIADGPPSTIQLGNGHGGAYYPEIAYLPLLFPSAKTRPPASIASSRTCSSWPRFRRRPANWASRSSSSRAATRKLVTKLTDLPEDERPRLLVFDLNNLNAKPIALIPKFKAKLKKATSIIGFLNHLQGELKAKAVEAGCDTVMPRSAFSQSLPNLLRRYGLEEEEDSFPQPA